MKLTSRPTRIAVPAAITIALLGGGVASATGTSTPSNTVYTACVTTGAHTLYGVTADGTPRCLGRDTKVTWNQTGPQGAPGTPGAPGAPGKDGAAVLNGSGAPANSLGKDGDFYLDTTSATLYGPRANGAWPTSGTSLVGPQGAPGTSGAHPFALVATAANTDSNNIFNGGHAELEAFCSGGPEFTLANWLGSGPALSVTGTVTPSSGATVTIDGNDVTPGFLSFTDAVHSTFWVRNGAATGQLLVTQGSTTFTVTFALTGGTDACLSSVQVTPTA